MHPAPAFDCAICRRRIGQHRTHYKLDDNRIICVGCLEQHHLYDNSHCSGTRAGIAHVLGLWP